MMHRLLHAVVLVTLTTLSLTLNLAAQSPSSGPFRAGAATSNITPDLGGPLVGGFVPIPSTNIHDELHARCLVLDDGSTRLAIVVCDLLGIDRVISEQARRLIAQRSNIPRERVLISATHTHSAVSALGKDARKLDQPADDYQQFVARRIADGVARAIHHLRPAKIAFGSAEAPEHVFNRRWHMRPGTAPVTPFGTVDMVKMNPPRGSENLLEPAGPTDPTVSFIAVAGIDDQPISLLAAYSLHYVGGVQRGDVSADYFAVFSEHLKQLIAASQPQDDELPPFVAMMANGTSGDINNINFRQVRKRQAPYQQMRTVGRDVAEKVFAALDSLEYQTQVALDAVYREPTIAWRKPTPQQLQWAKDTIAAGQQQEKDLPYIYAQRVMKQSEYPETTTIPVQTLRIGNICIGTLPFEVFCETGLAFKSQCEIENAFMIELAHGYFGYLPTPRHFQLGGYETWIGTNRVEPQAADMLLETLLEMTTELK